MANRKKKRLPFDNKGGVIAIPRPLIESNVYLSLSAQSKALMTLLQVHWKNYEPVAYGIREAQKKIPCAKRTAQKAFIELQEKGFITMIEESLFNSRTQSKSRTWKLNWLPYKDKPPTNEWKEISANWSNTDPVNAA